MKLITIILFIVSSTILNGQSTYFDHSFVENDTLDHYTDEFIGDIKSINNKYYAVGSYRDIANYSNPILYIFDEIGNLENKIIYEQDSIVSPAFHISESNEGILLSGRYDETTVSASDIFYIKTDYEGNLISFNTYGNPSYDQYNYNSEAIQKTIKSFENGHLTCGYRRTEGGNNNSAEIFIYKIANDSIVWETIIDNPNLIDLALDIEQNPIDSTYIVYTEQEEFISTFDRTQHIILIKIDEDGNIIEQSPNLKSDEDPNATILGDMAIDENGNIVFVGRRNGTGFICKVDSEYNLLWEKEVKPYPNHFVNFAHCIVASDGNYVGAGSLILPDSLQTQTELTGYLIKFDAETGDTIWYKEIVHYHTADSLIPNDHYVEALALAPDGGFVIGGYFFINGTNLPYNQASWIKKLDACGDEADFACDMNVGIFDNYYNELIKLSPNPCKDYLFVEGKGVFLDEFEIKDLNGRVVKKGNFNSSINVSNLSQGIYVVNFIGVKGSYKFVKM